MHNAYKQLADLLAPGPLQIGTVQAWADGIATVALPGDALVRARGQADIGARVFVRDGVIDGPAPELPIVTGEV